MSAAPLAALAAALGLLAGWELLAAVDVSALGRVVEPLLRARRDGSEPSTPERRRLALLGTVTLLAAGWLLAGPLAGGLAAIGGPAFMRGVVRERRRRHRVELERAAPCVARAIADALRAGHAVRGALAEAGRGLEGAARAELVEVREMLALGEPTEGALAWLCARAGSRAYDALAAAILLQRDAGGDLATLLGELATAQEEAIRLADDARAATAQARFTGVVVAALPIVAAAIAELASPGALAGVVKLPLAAWLAGFAVLLQGTGLLAIRRLARVRA
jgi:tight adherence protein B